MAIVHFPDPDSSRDRPAGGVDMTDTRVFIEKGFPEIEYEVAQVSGGGSLITIRHTHYEHRPLNRPADWAFCGKAVPKNVSARPLKSCDGECDNG